MALFRYFDKAKKDNLPDPRGPLVRTVPSSSIAAANSEVRAVLESLPSGGKKRGPYANYTAEQKALIEKRAAEHGVVAAIRYYTKDFPNLKENTVRDWRDAYRLELKKRRREGSEDGINVNELPGKKRGRPSLLGEELDKQV